MRQIGILICIIWSALMLSQCTFDQIPPGPIEVPDSVSFNLDVMPIFDESCNSAGCHNTGGIPPDLTQENAWVQLIYFNYVDTSDVENSLLMKKIRPGGSMNRFATEQEQEVIAKWIDQGALDN